MNIAVLVDGKSTTLDNVKSLALNPQQSEERVVVNIPLIRGQQGILLAVARWAQKQTQFDIATRTVGTNLEMDLKLAPNGGDFTLSLHGQRALAFRKIMTHAVQDKDANFGDSGTVEFLQEIVDSFDKADTRESPDLKGKTGKLLTPQEQAVLDKIESDKTAAQVAADEKAAADKRAADEKKAAEEKAAAEKAKNKV